MEDADKRKIMIVVLDRGYVEVCQVPQYPEAYALWMPVWNSRTIRYWGTTEGLGELANGPTPETRLDAKVPSGQFPVRAIIKMLDVDQSKWSAHLGV